MQIPTIIIYKVFSSLGVFPFSTRGSKPDRFEMKTVAELPGYVRLKRMEPSKVLGGNVKDAIRLKSDEKLAFNVGCHVNYQYVLTAKIRYSKEIPEFCNSFGLRVKKFVPEVYSANINFEKEDVARPFGCGWCNQKTRGREDWIHAIVVTFYLAP